MARLTELQQGFINNYVECGNGAAAARRAGYGKGAAVRACNLLKRPDIQEAIETQQMVMRFEAGVSRADLAQAAEDMFYKARTVRDQGRAIDIMAKLYGLYH
jgi:phage terminase small subunit